MLSALDLYLIFEVGIYFMGCMFVEYVPIEIKRLKSRRGPILNLVDSGSVRLTL